MPDNITGKNTGELTRITAAEVDAATHLLPWWNPDAIGADRTQAIVVNELVALIRNLLGPTGQEVVLASANPTAAPTDNEAVYIRRDTGDYWVAKADKSGWDGPFLAFTAGERSKLITIQSGATVNSSDATLLDRANHTGTQAIATVSGLQTALDGKDTAGNKTLTPTAIDPGNTATNSGFLSWLISAARSAQTTLAGLGALATRNTVGNAEITDINAAKINAGTINIARIPTGTTATTVAIGNDARLSDERTPLNGSVTDAKVAAGAAIAWSKISKTGAAPGDVGAQAASAKLTTIAGLTGTTPIRSDGTNGALTAAEIPSLDASKITTGTFADNQIPASIARDTEVTAAITAHEAAVDPHPQYLTPTEGNAAYQPLDSDLTAISALTTTGLIDRTGTGTATTRAAGATGLQVLAAANAAAVRTAAGLNRITPLSGGVAIQSGAANYSSSYALSVQNTTSSTWIEVLNSYGSNGGAFFGLSGSGVVGDTFDLYNWQGGSIRLHTAPTASAATNTWTLGSSGGTILPGVVAPKWYNGIAGLPAVNTVTYGSIGVVFDSGANPNTYPAITNGSAWLRILTLDSSGVARPSAIQIGNGATLSQMLTATKSVTTGTAMETITVTGAQVGDLAWVSRGFGAYVSAANTVTFNATEIMTTTTVRATVMRFS